MMSSSTRVLWPLIHNAFYTIVQTHANVIERRKRDDREEIEASNENGTGYSTTTLIGIFFGTLIGTLIIVFIILYILDHLKTKGSQESNNSKGSGSKESKRNKRRKRHSHGNHKRSKSNKNKSSEVSKPHKSDISDASSILTDDGSSKPKSEATGHRSHRSSKSENTNSSSASPSSSSAHSASSGKSPKHHSEKPLSDVEKLGTKSQVASRFQDSGFYEPQEKAPSESEIMTVAPDPSLAGIKKHHHHKHGKDSHHGKAKKTKSKDSEPTPYDQENFATQPFVPRLSTGKSMLTDPGTDKTYDGSFDSHDDNSKKK